MKYHIEGRGGQRVRLRTTGTGFVAELVGGVLVAVPWCVAAMTIFFLPDYIGAYRHDEGLVAAFWRMAPTLVAVISLGYGIRRAMSRAWVELDGGEGVVRIQYRALLGGEGDLYELPLHAVARVEVQPATLWHARQVVLVFDGGAEEAVARGWFVAAELEEVAAACREVCGLEAEGGSGPS